jgi:uncharacterized protein DUF6263
MILRLLLIAAVVFGCKKGDDDGAAVRAPDVHVVSAGQEPRQLLRYQAAKGTKRDLELALDIAATAGDMGGPMPTIVLTLSLVIEDVTPQGMKLRSTVVDAAARDRDDTRVDTKALAGPLDLMKGVVLTTTMAPSGKLTGTTIELGQKQLSGRAKSQLAALTTSFDQLMMTLPGEPVGASAVWRNSRPLEQNGMKLTAVNSVELIGITGDTISYEIDTEVHGDDQVVKQGDMQLDIKDITGTGTGKGTIDLRTLAVTSELDSEFRSSMQAGGEGSAMPMRMTISTKVTPK